jgi:hypothetical protein
MSAYVSALAMLAGVRKAQPSQLIAALQDAERKARELGLLATHSPQNKEH